MKFPPLKFARAVQNNGPDYWVISEANIKGTSFPYVASLPLERVSEAKLFTLAPEILKALYDNFALARLKFGNLDPDANKIFAATEAVLKELQKQ